MCTGSFFHSMTSRNWCFTIFNVDEISAATIVPADAGDSYACWQLECCPETGRQHVQGHIVFPSALRVPGVKRRFGRQDVHLEPRRGSFEQADAYCSKEETRVAGPWRRGSPPRGQGCRTDLETVQEHLDRGDPMSSIASQHFAQFVRYHRGFQLYRLLRAGRRDPDVEPTVVVLYGPTGTGKTSSVYSRYPDAYVVPPQQAGTGVGWWDGYDGQDVVLLDDFYGWLRYSFVLQLLDRYPLRVEYKGGSYELVATKFFITSNKHPQDWYDPSKFAYAPLERRITRIYHCEREYFHRLK